MTDIVLTPITSGYNLTKFNANFTKIQDAINNDVVHIAGGNNTMQQDFDLNGHALLNVGIDLSNPGSLLTLQAADARYYRFGAVPTAVLGGDAVNLDQVSQLIVGAGTGIIPSQIVTHTQFDPVAANVTANANRINIEHGLPWNTTTGFYTALQNNPKLNVSAGLTILETDGALSTYWTHQLVGTGRQQGIYGKNVIPEDAPDFYYTAKDLNPQHMRAFNNSAAPVAVLVGDSISTYYANSNGNVQSMLTEMLRSELRNQASPRNVTFYDRAIGAQTYVTLDSTPAGLTTYPEWYTNTANSWLSYIQALNPDVVFLSFGMNQSGNTRLAMESIVAKIKAWTKVPDIVFCTNLSPNPNPSFDSIEEQEARLRWAGLTRSFAKFYGYGLLDFGRAENMARDGYDPCQGYVQKQNVLTAQPTGQFLPSSYSTYGFVTQINIDSTKIPAQGATYQPVTVKYGYGSEEQIHFYKDIASGNYKVRLYYGNSVFGDTSVVQADQTVVLNNISGILVVKVERFGNHIAVFDMVGAFNTGETRDPVFEATLMSMGGRYQVAVAPTQAGAITSCSFGQVYPVVNKPVIQSPVLFGGTTFTGTDYEFGGQGYNHPSSHVGWSVYSPVLRVSTFSDSPKSTFGSGYEQYMAYVDGAVRKVTRNFGRLAINVTAAGTIAWSTPLAVPTTTKVLNASAGLGSFPGTATSVVIYPNSSYGSLGAQTTANGNYITNGTAGVLLIDWQVIGY